MINENSAEGTLDHNLCNIAWNHKLFAGVYWLGFEYNFHKTLYAHAKTLEFKKIHTGYQNVYPSLIRFQDF